MEAVFVSLGLVFLAELGDKSQLMAIAFATRYRARVVLAGVTIATVIMSGLSALLGGLLGDFLPTDAVQIAAGIAFLVFAALALLPERDDDGDGPLTTRRSGAALVIVALTFGAAELGDKTMLTAMTLATQHPWYLVWIGSTIGMVASAALAVFAGRALLGRLPERAVKLVSAAAFAAVGLWLLLG